MSWFRWLSNDRKKSESPPVLKIGLVSITPEESAKRQSKDAYWLGDTKTISELHQLQIFVGKQKKINKQRFIDNQGEDNINWDLFVKDPNNNNEPIFNLTEQARDKLFNDVYRCALLPDVSENFSRGSKNSEVYSLVTNIAFMDDFDLIRKLLESNEIRACYEEHAKGAQSNFIASLGANVDSIKHNNYEIKKVDYFLNLFTLFLYCETWIKNSLILSTDAKAAFEDLDPTHNKDPDNQWRIEMFSAFEQIIMQNYPGSFLHPTTKAANKSS